MILHVKVKLFGIFPLLLIVAIQINLYGASPAPPPKTFSKKGIEGHFSLGFLYNQGNYITRTGTMNLAVKYYQRQNLILFNSTANYGEINYNGEKYIENVNEYSVEFKHMLFFKPKGKSYFFYGIGDMGNLFAGIKNRLNINEGLGYNFIHTNKFLLRGEFGFENSDSKYLFQKDQRTVSGMLYYQINYEPVKNFKIVNWGIYLSNLSYPEYQDYRFDDVISIITVITNILNLKSDFVVSYVNIPPLIAQVDSLGVPIPGKQPIKGKRVSIRLQQAVMVRF